MDKFTDAIADAVKNQLFRGKAHASIESLSYAVAEDAMKRLVDAAGGPLHVLKVEYADPLDAALHGEYKWTLQHPLTERLSDDASALFECGVMQFIEIYNPPRGLVQGYHKVWLEEVGEGLGHDWQTEFIRPLEDVL